MSDWRTHLESLKVKADKQGLTPTQVRAITKTQIKSLLGLTPEQDAEVEPKFSQIIERTANHRRAKEDQAMLVSISKKLTTAQKAWIKDNAESSSLYLEGL